MQACSNNANRGRSNKALKACAPPTELIYWWINATRGFSEGIAGGCVLCRLGGFAIGPVLWCPPEYEDVGVPDEALLRLCIIVEGNGRCGVWGVS